jgi:hypothetical protein
LRNLIGCTALEILALFASEPKQKMSSRFGSGCRPTSRARLFTEEHLFLPTKLRFCQIQKNPQRFAQNSVAVLFKKLFLMNKITPSYKYSIFVNLQNYY